MPKTVAGGGGNPSLITTDDLVRRRELWPIAEAIYRLGIGKTTLYRERDRGRIAIVKVGGRAYVTDREIRRYIEELEREAS